MTCYKGRNCPNNVTTIPRIRWYLYSKFKCEFNQLPPTQAALKYKIFRSHYVTLNLRRAYLAITNLLSLGHGWEAKDGVYMPSRTDELSVPLELMELSVCRCKTSRNTIRCKWIKNQLMCTDLCKCISCKNDGTCSNDAVHDDRSGDHFEGHFC